MSTWDNVTWSYCSAQKRKSPHPGTQIPSQIPKGGEGNRGQMSHVIMPGVPHPPSGLTLIDALRDVTGQSYPIYACNRPFSKMAAENSNKLELDKIKIVYQH